MKPKNDGLSILRRANLGDSSNVYLKRQSLMDMTTYKTIDIITGEISKKSWKTYKGALKNCKSSEIVSTPEGIDWMLRHPDWANQRLTETLNK